MIDPRPTSALPYEWGLAEQPYPGEQESGDQYLLEPFDNGLLIAVIDALGHGAKASRDGKAAVESLRGHAKEPIQELFKRSHQTLLRSRGVVMTLANLNFAEARVTWLGIGNVKAVTLRKEGINGVKRNWFMPRGGVVGYQLPTLRPIIEDLKPGDTLIMVTDGIRSSFAENIDITLSPQAIADHIQAEHRRGTDDSLVAVVRYLGKPAE